MPTQDERVTTLEQTFTSSQREQARQNRKTDENLTILLGLVQTQSIEIKRIFTRLDTMEQRFDSVDSRLETIEQDMHESKNMLTQILERLSKPQ